MRDWLVGGGLILDGSGLLLVRNLRRSGEHDWTPPGGVIDAGESLIDGLTREVAEETGVKVSRWQGPVYEVEVVAPGLGWRLRVEAHLALEFSHGDLHVDDPDGIVVEAAYVDAEDCEGHLAGCHRWVSEPLGEWLSDRWVGGRRYRYCVDGDDPRTATVSRR
ncbi:MAG TPA: NUDIX hydrolase [Acidimicrobiales bacterium]|nr:NUDIX hydrolase [Acidimicrobiales bacterium]